MDSFPQFTRSTLWRNLLEWGQLFSKEILWWAGDFPGAVFHGGNCPGGNFPREPLFRARFFSGAINPRRNCPGAIIQGEIVRGDNFPRGQLSGHHFLCMSYLCYLCMSLIILSHSYSQPFFGHVSQKFTLRVLLSFYLTFFPILVWRCLQKCQLLETGSKWYIKVISFFSLFIEHPWMTLLVRI